MPHVLTITSVGTQTPDVQGIHDDVDSALAEVAKFAGNAYRVNTSVDRPGWVTGTLSSAPYGGTTHQAAWSFSIIAEPQKKYVTWHIGYQNYVIREADGRLVFDADGRPYVYTKRADAEKALASLWDENGEH